MAAAEEQRGSGCGAPVRVGKVPGEVGAWQTASYFPGLERGALLLQLPPQTYLLHVGLLL